MDEQEFEADSEISLPRQPRRKREATDSRWRNGPILNHATELLRTAAGRDANKSSLLQSQLLLLHWVAFQTEFHQSHAYPLAQFTRNVNFSLNNEKSTLCISVLKPQRAHAQATVGRTTYLKAMDLISRFAILCIGGHWRGTLARSRSSARPLTLTGELNTDLRKPGNQSFHHLYMYMTIYYNSTATKRLGHSCDKMQS